MNATIWHNPACGTSRKTLAILQETPAVDLTVIEYLKNPYSADKLQQLFADAKPHRARRVAPARHRCFEERGLKDASDAVIIAAMAANPYVERPFVETDKGVRLCRFPQDRVHEIL